MTPIEFEGWLGRQGMNPNQVAEFLGIDRKTVDRYLNGDLPIPRRIALALAAFDGLKLYRLVPIDITENDWRASSFRGEVIVRAQTEDLARWHAATRFHRFARRRSAGEDTPLNPWTNPARVSAEELREGTEGYSLDGQPGIVKGPEPPDFPLHLD